MQLLNVCGCVCVRPFGSNLELAKLNFRSCFSAKHFLKAIYDQNAL